MPEGSAATAEMPLSPDRMGPDEHVGTAIEPVSVVPSRPISPWTTGKPPIDVVVVGGGASAVLIVSHYLNELEAQQTKGQQTPPLNIHVVYKNGRVGRGNVYLKHQRALDVNQSAKHMSLAGNDKDDFVNFLCFQASDFEGAADYENEFTSRANFGFYAEEQFGVLMRRAASLGARVLPVKNTTVGDIIPLEENRGFKVLFSNPGNIGKFDADGPGIDARQVFLAIGHIKRTDHMGQKNCFSITDQASYEEADLAIRGLPPSASVVSIGFGPTVVDHVRMLDQLDYTGQHTIIRRHDMDLWANMPEREGKINYVLGFNLAAVEECNASDPLDIERKLIHLIGNEIKRTEEKGGSGYDVLYSKEFADLFRSISGQTNYAFTGVAYQTIERFMAATIPMADWVRIQRQELNGHIKFELGDVRFFGEDAGKVKVEYQSMDGKKAILSKEADVVLVGNPWATNYRNESLLKNLYHRGLARFDDDILRCTGAGELVAGAGLFAIGPFAKYNGDIIQVWGIESFDRQAGFAARKAVQDLIRYHASLASNGAVSRPGGPVC